MESGWIREEATGDRRESYGGLVMLLRKRVTTQLQSVFGDWTGTGKLGSLRVIVSLLIYIRQELFVFTEIEKVYGRYFLIS